MFSQPNQMQMRAKIIAKRVQTKKTAPTIIAENYKHKIINSNFAKKNTKRSAKYEENTSQPRLLFPKAKIYKSARQNSKRAPQTPNKTPTTHLGRKVHRPWKFPKTVYLAPEAAIFF